MIEINIQHIIRKMIVNYSFLKVMAIPIHFTRNRALIKTSIAYSRYFIEYLDLN